MTTPGHSDAGRGEASTWIAVAFGLATVASLVLPWHSLFGTSRSTVELLGSASALDALGGFDKAAVTVAWLAVPFLTAGALIAAAARRPRLVGRLLAPLGPLAVAAVALVAAKVPGDLAWGAWVAVGVATLASLAGALLVWAGVPASRCRNN